MRQNLPRNHGIYRFRLARLDLRGLRLRNKLCRKKGMTLRQWLALE